MCPRARERAAQPFHQSHPKCPSQPSGRELSEHTPTPTVLTQPRCTALVEENSVIKDLLRLQCIAAFPWTDPVGLGTEPCPGCCLPSLPEAAADPSATLNACPDPAPPKQAGEFEPFKHQIRLNPKHLGCSRLGKHHTIGTGWRHEEAESCSSASSEGRSESKSRLASWSSKPAFCSLRCVYAPISPLKPRQK